MQGIGYGNFWCPRCGSILMAEGNTSAPMLVKRVNDLRSEASDGYDDRGQDSLIIPIRKWNALGISECLGLPERRT